MPHLVATLIYLSQNYSYYIRGDISPLRIWGSDRQTDRYFIDRKKVNPDLFVIEIRERYLHVYTTLLIC